MKKRILIYFLIAFFAFGCLAQNAKKEDEIKYWRMPSYMIENLRYMADDFNRRFREKKDQYENELRTRFKEFKDMPEDVVFDFERGIFISLEDLMKLQQAQKEVAEENAKKNEEVKK